MKNFIIPITLLLCLSTFSCQKDVNGFKLSENNVIEISPNEMPEQSILKIRKNIYLEHVEDQFDFFFPEITGCSSDRFISFYSSEKYKRHLDFLNQVNDDASNMVGHLPDVGNQNDPVLMFFNI